MKGIADLKADISDLKKGENATVPKKGECYMGKNSNGLQPADFPSEEVVTSDFTMRPEITNLMHPHLEPGRSCFYQCAAWNAISLPGFISSVGSITVGAAIIVSITESISEKVGPKMITSASEP